MKLWAEADDNPVSFHTAVMKLTDLLVKRTQHPPQCKNVVDICRVLVDPQHARMRES